MSLFINRWTVSGVALTTLLALKTGVPYITAPQIFLTLSISGAYVSLGLFGVYLMTQGGRTLLAGVFARMQQPPQLVVPAPVHEPEPQLVVPAPVLRPDLIVPTTPVISQPPHHRPAFHRDNYDLRDSPYRGRRRTRYSC